MQYKQEVHNELMQWQKKMMKEPSLLNNLSKGVQNRINHYLPEKWHKTITAAIRKMTKAVIFGAAIVQKEPSHIHQLAATDVKAKDIITSYRKTAAIEGGITGAGGILLGLADFPILLGIKLKLLFELAALYGFDVNDYRERIFLLHVFQLAFSSQQHRKKIFMIIRNWEEEKEKLPADLNQFDWRNFQQEYRDYIDLVKLAQLVPGIGAVVGLVANYQLISQLGTVAMNAYRMRLFKKLPDPE